MRNEVETVKSKAFEYISSRESDLIRISDTIWGFAELGLQEFKSSALLADELRKAGFEMEMGVAGMPTAFVATYGSGKPTLGIMGEYDALPGLSQKPIPKRDPLIEGAPGHGCGHNIHGTSGMAAAIAIKTVMSSLNIKGTLKFFGTPAEENASGKDFMVRDGIFDDLDAVLSHHPSRMNSGGYISNNAINVVKFRFYGTAAHASASPEQGRSALDAVELMNVGVNYLREHIINDARIHYVIESGGVQPNVVPDYAASWYYVRAPERDQVDQIYARVLDIAKGASLMTGTNYKVQFITGHHSKLLNKTLSELVVRSMRKIPPIQYTDEEREFARQIGKTVTMETKRETLKKTGRPGWEKLMNVDIDQTVPDLWEHWGPGSTDVSSVTWKAPTVEFWTATWVLGTPGHSWQNAATGATGIGHKSLIFAAKTMSSCLIDLLTQPQLLKQIKEEFAQRLDGRHYKSPLPPDLKPPLDMWTKK